LRALTGRDPTSFASSKASAACRAWPTTSCSSWRRGIPEHQTANRRYLTVAIGCTGGPTPLGYLAERIAERLSQQLPRDRHPAQFPRRNALHHARPDTHQRPVRVTAFMIAFHGTPALRRRLLSWRLIPETGSTEGLQPNTLRRVRKNHRATHQDVGFAALGACASMNAAECIGFEVPQWNQFPESKRHEK